MLILAVDTSGKNGSIALARAGEGATEVEIIQTMPLPGGTFSAQLVPQVAALLHGQGVAIAEVDAFAVASGPGSFTGIRVGLAAVKAFAEVTRKPIAAVSLLELCIHVSGAQGKVLAVLDAGRGDVFVGKYQIPAIANESCEEYLVSRNEFISQAKGWTVVTPDATLADATIAAGLQVNLLNPISAADVAYLGANKIRRGETVNSEQLQANYIRRTDAEMLERMGS